MSLKQLWQSGLEAQHTDELINNCFRFFAPYAGADQERVTFIKQSEYNAQNAITFEESGDFSMSFAHSRAGLIAFSTFNEVVADVMLRFPIGTQTGGAPVPASMARTPTDVNNDLPLPRFHFIGCGHRLLQGLPKVPRRVGQGEFGQLELDFNIPALWKTGRHAVGFRVGPAAFACAGQPVLLPDVQVGTTEGDGNEAQQRSLLTEEQRLITNYTIDAAVCLPLGGSRETQDEKGSAPWSVNIGVRHPLAIGDTLAAICIENSRLVQFARTFANNTNSTNNFTGKRSLLDAADGSYHLPLFSDDQSHHDKQLTHFSPCPNQFKLLIVQTLASRTYNNDASLLSDLDLTRSSSWQRSSRLLQENTKTLGELPTLVAAHVSLMEEQLQLTAASIFHDGEADVEAAIGVDMTPITGYSRPTRLQVGWNKTGQWALALTTMLFNAVSITLGVHIPPTEESWRYGIEIKC